MSRAMRVFGGNYDGRHQRMVAATTQKEAMRLIGVRSRSDWANFYGEWTGQAAQIAMAEPGVVWERSMSVRDSEWKRVNRA